MKALDDLDQTFNVKPGDAAASALEEKIKNAVRSEPKYFGRLFRPLKNFAASGRAITAIVLSRDGKRAITGGEGSIEFWEGQLVHMSGSWKNPAQGIGAPTLAAPALDTNRDRTAVRKGAYEIVIYDVNPAKYIGEFPPLPRNAFTQYPSCWSLSANGEKLAIAVYNELAIYNIGNLTSPIWKTTMPQNVGALTFREDGSVLFAQLALMFGAPIVKVDTSNGRVIGQIPGDNRQSDWLQLSPDRTKLIAGKSGVGGGLAIIDVVTGNEMFRHNSWDAIYSISPDWKSICFDEGKTIDFFDVVSGENSAHDRYRLLWVQLHLLLMVSTYLLEVRTAVYTCGALMILSVQLPRREIF